MMALGVPIIAQAVIAGPKPSGSVPVPALVMEDSGPNVDKTGARYFVRAVVLSGAAFAIGFNLHSLEAATTM